MTSKYASLLVYLTPALLHGMFDNCPVGRTSLTLDLPVTVENVHLLDVDHELDDEFAANLSWRRPSTCWAALSALSECWPRWPTGIHCLTSHRGPFNHQKIFWGKNLPGQPRIQQHSCPWWLSRSTQRNSPPSCQQLGEGTRWRRAEEPPSYTPPQRKCYTWRTGNCNVNQAFKILSHPMNQQSFQSPLYFQDALWTCILRWDSDAALQWPGGCQLGGSPCSAKTKKIIFWWYYWKISQIPERRRSSRQWIEI